MKIAKHRYEKRPTHIIAPDAGNLTRCGFPASAVNGWRISVASSVDTEYRVCRTCKKSLDAEQREAGPDVAHGKSDAEVTLEKWRAWHDGVPHPLEVGR